MKAAKKWLWNLLAVVGLLVVLATFTPFTYWYATLLAGPWRDPTGDILIILGASHEERGHLSRDTYLRTVYGWLAWQQGGFRKVVVTGRIVSSQMRDYLIYAGVPAEAILVEERAISTRENAVFTAELLRGDNGRKVLLTSDLHMFRAVRVFRNAGLVVEPRPVPDVRKRAGGYGYRWSSFLDLTLETTKIAWYGWKGWL